MGNMAVGLMVFTSQIEMTWLEMGDCWILRRGEGIDICIILVLIRIGTMIIIVIILTRGVIGDTCYMILINKSHLLLIEI